MNKKLFVLLFILGIMLVIPLTNQIYNNNSILSAQTPMVDGLFYGEPSGPGSSDFAQGSYSHIGTATDGRGAYYSRIIGNMLYIAVVVDARVNDNVFGLKPSDVDDAYLISAGWISGGGAKEHDLQKLISSDNMHMTVTTDCGTWDWDMGYLHVNSNPSGGHHNTDPINDWIWYSGTDDPNGSVGNLPPDVLVAHKTSGHWNMENTLWDMTIGGTRDVGGWQLSKIGEALKSPFVDPNDITTGVGYPTWDATNLWEWQLVYEMQLDLSDCNPSSAVIAINPAHNSPAKDFENIIIQDLYDWGDLPEGNDPFTGLPYAQQYPTLLASEGPRHLLYPGGPYLGCCVDSENDGCPCEGADGDDNDGNNDNDGVAFVALNPTGGSGATIPIGTAQFDVVAGTDGILNAWVDWNADGDFDDTNERIANEMVLTSGSHSLIVDTIDEPDEVLYHRWRFTSSTGEANTPSGVAPNGEVEDYMDTEVPLPVELSYFKVNIASNGVLCEWLTESEIENLGFILERKTDDDWQAIASYKSDSDLMGQGTTSAPKVYEYLDGLVEVNTTYSYRLADIDYDGVVTYHAERTVKVEHTPNVSIVQELMVLPAYPNPFNPTTSIDYAIPVNGIVKITIYDLLGSRIKTLLNMEQVAGWHHVQWNGDDDNGVQMSAGMYLVSINTGQNIKTMKLLLIK